MSDPIIKQPIALMKDKRPFSCFIDQIYDPDKDGLYKDTDDFPRVVPMEGAAAIERATGNLYYVKYVDPNTYKSTLAPTRIVVNVDQEEIKLVSYGIDRYTCFLNNDHKPAQLTVAANFMAFGSSIVEYQLYKRDTSGNREVVSIYLDSDEIYRGNRIPMMAIMPGSPIKQCTNCHTLSMIATGDTLEMDLFDNVGILVMTIRLLVVNSITLNDLASDSDMIVGLDATALQQLPDGSFYMYQRQGVDHLGIVPRLEYHDGRYADLAIDNKTCFCYGLENFTPSYPGQKQKIIIKKFLGPKEYANLDPTESNQRFVICEKFITVLANKSLSGIKISVMPIWNSAANNYFLKYIAYSESRDRVVDVTGNVNLLADIDTGKFGEKQMLYFNLDLSEVFGVELTVPYAQKNWMTFQNANQYQRYIISDDEFMDVTYGAESSMRRRPVIHYDADLGKYFIPTSRFGNITALLDAFYKCASPPVNVISEVDAPTPTHFTIRGLDTLSTLITTPIPLSTFNVAWSINRVGRTDILVGSNVIVEFLKEQGNDYQILYGVPVDVHTSATGYNTEPNDII